MVEVQLICKVLQDKSLSKLLDNGISVEHFIQYKDEFQFIFDHHTKFSLVPDKETFLDKFFEFDYIQVNESYDYMVDKLKEQYLFTKLTPFVHELAKIAEKDSREAVEFIQGNIGNFLLKDPSTQTYDLARNANEREVEYRRRLDTKGLLGVTTGIEQLDKITHGWVNNDFVIITGRLGEGKTWVLLFFLVAAWKSGKRVLLYSGEMDRIIMGFRFDTLNEHFSNDGLMEGNEELGEKTSADYFKYLSELSEDDSTTPFIIVTPKDLGGKRLDIPKLHQLIEKHKPDIIGIDQVSLMSDYRWQRGEPTRVQYTHIAEDLYLTSDKYGIPVLSPTQANRDAAKDKDQTPKNDNVAESDGVPQNATRNIAIKQVDKTLKITVRKNRYGKDNQEILLIWDIDKGYIKPFLRVETDSSGVTTDTEFINTSGEELF